MMTSLKYPIKCYKFIALRITEPFLNFCNEITTFKAKRTAWKWPLRWGHVSWAIQKVTPQQTARGHAEVSFTQAGSGSIWLFEYIRINQIETAVAHAEQVILMRHQRTHWEHSTWEIKVEHISFKL